LDRRMEIETERWEAERDELKTDLRRSQS